MGRQRSGKCAALKSMRWTRGTNKARPSAWRPQLAVQQNRVLAGRSFPLPSPDARKDATRVGTWPRPRGTHSHRITLRSRPCAVAHARFDLARPRAANSRPSPSDSRSGPKEFPSAPTSDVTWAFVLPPASPASYAGASQAAQARLTPPDSSVPMKESRAARLSSRSMARAFRALAQTLHPASASVTLRAPIPARRSTWVNAAITL